MTGYPMNQWCSNELVASVLLRPEAGKPQVVVVHTGKPSTEVIRSEKESTDTEQQDNNGVDSQENNLRDSRSTSYNSGILRKLNLKSTDLGEVRSADEIFEERIEEIDKG
nr:hypothetical protein CFP56_08686 [Quercus suber]